MRAKISSLKPYLAFLIVCVLLAVMLVTQHNGLPHGVGIAAFAVLAAFGFWVFQ